MDLSGFIYGYNKVSDNKIDFCDFSFEKAESRDFRLTKGNVLLSLKEGEDGKICECSLYLIKLNEKGKDSETIAYDSSEFISMLRSTLQAYCGYDANTADTLIEEFSLNKSDTFLKQGELTKTQDNFYFVFYSTKLTSSMSVCNKYLQEIEPTQKPVSKPAYGEDVAIDE